MKFLLKFIYLLVQYNMNDIFIQTFIEQVSKECNCDKNVLIHIYKRIVVDLKMCQYVFLRGVNTGQTCNAINCKKHTTVDQSDKTIIKPVNQSKKNKTKPTTTTITKSINQSKTKPTNQSKTKPTDQSEKTITKPTVQSKTKPTVQSEKTITKPTDQSEKTITKPTVQSKTKPTDHSNPKPTDQSDHSKIKPIDQLEKNKIKSIDQSEKNQADQNKKHVTFIDSSPKTFYKSDLNMIHVNKSVQEIASIYSKIIPSNIIPRHKRILPPSLRV